MAEAPKWQEEGAMLKLLCVSGDETFSQLFDNRPVADFVAVAPPKFTTCVATFATHCDILLSRRYWLRPLASDIRSAVSIRFPPFLLPFRSAPNKIRAASVVTSRLARHRSPHRVQKHSSETDNGGLPRETPLQERKNRFDTIQRHAPVCWAPAEAGTIPFHHPDAGPGVRDTSRTGG